MSEESNVFDRDLNKAYRDRLDQKDYVDKPIINLEAILKELEQRIKEIWRVIDKLDKRVIQLENDVHENRCKENEKLPIY